MQDVSDLTMLSTLLLSIQQAVYCRVFERMTCVGTNINVSTFAVCLVCLSCAWVYMQLIL